MAIYLMLAPRHSTFVISSFPLANLTGDILHNDVTLSAASTAPLVSGKRLMTKDQCHVMVEDVALITDDGTARIPKKLKITQEQLA